MSLHVGAVLAEGQPTNRWELEFGTISFTISRGPCIASGVSVFFPFGAFVTCCFPFQVSLPGKSRGPEVVLQPLLSMKGILHAPTWRTF
jgi:hypothetical protein